MRVGIVGDAEIDVEADEFVAKGPVDHPVGDEVLVRNEVFASIPGDDGNEAGAQLADPAECAFQRDGVARFDRLVEQDDDAGYEVGDDLLQTEAETEADRPGEDGEGGQIGPATRINPNFATLPISTRIDGASSSDF